MSIRLLRFLRVLSLSLSLFRHELQGRCANAIQVVRSPIKRCKNFVGVGWVMFRVVSLHVCYFAFTTYFFFIFRVTRICYFVLTTNLLQVFDCWFESGSMPYAQSHYPFENKQRFETGFPADFIAEGLDQTRGWFYTLMVLSTALFDKPAWKNLIVNGLVLAADGKKMSKYVHFVSFFFKTFILSSPLRCERIDRSAFISSAPRIFTLTQTHASLYFLLFDAPNTALHF